MSGKLSLQATWSHDPLPALNEQSLAYLVVDIKDEAPTEGAEQAAVRVAPLNLSLVLDTSGSMSGAKMQNLKQAVGWVIDHLTPQDNLAVTLFDDEVHPLVASTPVTDPKGLRAKIDAIREMGGTAMSKGLLVGLDEAMKGRKPGAISRIVVLTDGQTWGDGDKCKQLAEQAGEAGIPITALGVGADEDWSIELLDALAAESGGVSDYIAKPDEISHAFEGTLKTMQATTSRNLRMSFNPAGGVSLRAVYRVAPIISKLWPAGEGPRNGSDSGDKSLTLPVGEIQSGGGQTLLFEVVVPPRKPGQYRLARLLLQYESGVGSAEKSDDALDLTVSFAAGAGKGQGNPRVMNIVEKATTFKLQTRALNASMMGDVEGATRNLRVVATRLLNMGEADLAEAAEQEAQLMETRGQMSAAGTKKLAFDTRRLSD